MRAGITATLTSIQLGGTASSLFINDQFAAARSCGCGRGALRSGDRRSLCRGDRRSFRSGGRTIVRGKFRSTVIRMDAHATLLGIAALPGTRFSTECTGVNLRLGTLLSTTIPDAALDGVDVGSFRDGSAV